jgi:hypothetical protein
MLKLTSVDEALPFALLGLTWVTGLVDATFMRTVIYHDGLDGVLNSRLTLPAQMVDATLACSLLAGVAKPRVFRGR